MDTIRVTYLKRIRKAKADRTGLFQVSAHEGTLVCEGPAPTMPRNMPLIIKGEKSSTGTFLVSDIQLDFDNEKRMQKMLSGAAFRKMGNTLARKVYVNIYKEAKKTKTEADLFRVEDLRRLASDAGADDVQAGLVASVISGMRTRAKIYEMLRPVGSPYDVVENLFEKYGNDAVSKMTENPYLGMQVGLPFKDCHTLAESAPYIKKEDLLKAVCNHVGEILRQNGNSCFCLENALRVMERDSGHMPKAYLLSVLLSDRSFNIVNNPKYGPVIYPPDLYKTEEGICANLARLERTSRPFEFDGMVPDNLDEDQKAALLGIMERSGFAIVTGAPGSGKTTLIKTIIEAFRKARPMDEISLCAPTGRAAARISESINGKDAVNEKDKLKAVTVHRLIGAKPQENDTNKFTYNQFHQLPRGLYIADEASMMDEKITEAFLQAVPDDSLLIFCGDPDQLLSVNTGVVLKDMIESARFRTYRLTKIHRQAEESLIAVNYHKIVNREFDLKTGDSFEIIRVDTDEEIIHEVDKLYEKYDSPSPYGFQILTCVKKGETGKDKINSRIAAKRHKDRDRFQTGDRVMMTANNYAEDYRNGDVGYITRMTEGGAWVAFYDGTKFIKRDSFTEMDHAWACTIHKAQGSEYDVTAVVLDGNYENMMHNRMILTAVTRAKEKCYIITKGNVLERCIASYNEVERITGLKQMLEKTEI